MNQNKRDFNDPNRVVLPFGELKQAIFLERKNRFIARVEIEGSILDVHVPSTGRLDTVLKKGLSVYLKASNNPSRKTPYSLLLVQQEGGLVCVDAILVNHFTRLMLQHQWLPSIPSEGIIQQEYKMGESRFDFAIHERKTHLLEVKSVNMVVDEIAYFPDAPSERGTKHVEELIHWHQHGFPCHLLFVVQRGDAKCFSPHFKRDPKFSDAVKRALEIGIETKACLTDVTLDGMYWDSWLPIKLDQ
ncbi:DNA/RNA nuclease SfsA [Microaerobacter geothermalis]|uniref:DNA/RNA nuclease SfsA n=1 Tax=Microaerobacter geothermalis TaxID=674972 RepID=UPI001F1E6CB0|nr:DNA/RNA nuclease SfsA [Microaerobacter geothermalis]MCF6092621.1 DNA/RNA nuclease SfsA [Microaerobacter geothermalis]